MKKRTKIYSGGTGIFTHEGKPVKRTWDFYFSWIWIIGFFAAITFLILHRQ